MLHAAVVLVVCRVLGYLGLRAALYRKFSTDWSELRSGISSRVSHARMLLC
jgi:hypothetical protein